MKRKTIRRVMLAILLAATGGAAAGYWAAPAQPAIFAHLPPGAFVGEYRSMRDCQAARQAFAAGRGFPVRGNEILITPGFTDLCSRRIKALGGR